MLPAILPLPAEPFPSAYRKPEGKTHCGLADAAAQSGFRFFFLFCGQSSELLFLSSKQGACNKMKMNLFISPQKIVCQTEQAANKQDGARNKKDRCFSVCCSEYIQSALNNTAGAECDDRGRPQS